MKIKGNDFDSVFKQVSDSLISQPIFSPRGLDTKELINQTLVIEHPMECILSNPHRKLSLDYVNREFDWYMSGELTIDGIKDHASMWKSLLNPDGYTINSNYGYYVFNQEVNGVNQFDWVVNSLKKDESSRQAIINFNQPKHKFEANKDFVCTINNQFLIRDNKLISLVNMRSCDLIFGASYDIPWFSYVQYRVYKELLKTYPQLQIGRLEHTSASLHIYERHFNMLDLIIADINIYESKNLIQTLPQLIITEA